MPSDVALALIGYLGSSLVVILVATSSIIRLRFLDLAGSLVATVHGALIGSLPITLTDVLIVGSDGGSGSDAKGFISRRVGHVEKHQGRHVSGMGFARTSDSVHLTTARGA